LLPLVSRRAFLASAAACAAAGPALLRSVVHEPGHRALLHLATLVERKGHVHTFALRSDGCRLLGSTAVDSFATFAAHPVLPVLYVARDCGQWENLPRGVIETYAVGLRPLRLLAQTPMALSATGPRSLAVSSCGRHLLVSASTGGAWNSFALDRDGMPTSPAIARKETGAMRNSNSVSLPTPHGLAFSPHGPFAAGTDPGSGRMTLLHPSPEGIAALARFQTPCGLSASRPVWTSDGRYIIVSNAGSASLSIYEMQGVSEGRRHASFHLLGTSSTGTPVTSLMAHPVEPGIFTSRPQQDGSRLELWKVHSSDLRIASNTWVSGHIVALAQHAAGLWAASQDRLIRIPIGDLRSSCPVEVPLPMHGAQAIATQNLDARYV
jgi:Lactonase, 7-bladed beta-propeller